MMGAEAQTAHLDIREAERVLEELIKQAGKTSSAPVPKPDLLKHSAPAVSIPARGEEQSMRG